MKIGIALVGLFASTVMPAVAQRASEVHQWAPLVRIGADLVDIDTAAVRTHDHIREVWLRWSGQTGPGVVSVYSIERREIDCARRRTRVLEDEEVGGRPSLNSARPPVAQGGGPDIARRSAAQPAGRLAEWYQPSAGSLVALALRAACEPVGQAGA